MTDRHLPRPPISLARKPLVWVLWATLGGFLFGYNAGVISGALLYVRQDFGLGAFEQASLAGVLPLGAMFGGLLAARMADGLGRRRALLAAALVFLAGAAASVVAPGYLVLLAARAITGIAVGAASALVPLYISEIAPPEERGRLVTLNQVMLTLGIVVSYVVDLIFASSGAWRAMFGVGLIPAVALLIGAQRAPETPVWLAGRGQIDRAREVLSQTVDADRAERLAEELGQAQGQEARSGPRELLGPAVRPALIVGVTLAAMQQLTGINAIVYYAPQIMEKTGLGGANAIALSVIVGIVNVVATVVSFRLVDREGRRSLLLLSSAGVAVSLTLLGLTLELSLGTAGSWLSLIAILSCVTSFAIGLGPVFWLLIAEIFPPRARAAGASVSTSVNWFSNFAVGLAFLPLAAAIGDGPTFWIFAGASALTFAFVQRYVPETQGRGFSEIEREVRERWYRRSAEKSDLKRAAPRPTR